MSIKIQLTHWTAAAINTSSATGLKSSLKTGCSYNTSVWHGSIMRHSNTTQHCVIHLTTHSTVSFLSHIPSTCEWCQHSLSRRLWSAAGYVQETRPNLAATSETEPYCTTQHQYTSLALCRNNTHHQHCVITTYITGTVSLQHTSSALCHYNIRHWHCVVTTCVTSTVSLQHTSSALCHYNIRHWHSVITTRHQHCAFPTHITDNVTYHVTFNSPVIHSQNFKHLCMGVESSPRPLANSVRLR